MYSQRLSYRPTFPIRPKSNLCCTNSSAIDLSICLVPISYYEKLMAVQFLRRMQWNRQQILRGRALPFTKQLILLKLNNIPTLQKLLEG